MTRSGITLSEFAGQTGPDDRYLSCIVCGGRQLRPLERYAETHLVRCASCGLTFAGRRPSDEELEQHYRGYGTRWFDSELTRQRYRELLDSLEPYRDTNRLLDMGCGAGYFVEEAVGRGWDAVGSEFGERAIQMSRDRGLNVIPAPLELTTFPTGHFDVITSFEVVEHVRDPVAEARVIAAMLRPGGVFYCTTPNFNAMIRALRGPRWTVISYPEHLIYFTRATLTRWLAAAGLSPLQVLTTGISPAALASAAPIAAAPFAARATAPQEPDQTLDQRLRSVIESTGALRHAKSFVNRGLTLTGTGDTLKGWFRRNS